MQKSPAPRDQAEAIAVFRAQVIGPLLCREHLRGQLDKILLELSTIPVRPPGSDVTRTYAVATLRRWYYRYRQNALEGLRPVSRKRGYARALSRELRDLICDIRRARPGVSAQLIVRTLEMDGRIEKNEVSVSSVRRLLREQGLDRVTLRQASGDKNRRRRWEAEAPMALWHADVCHGPSLRVGDRHVPLRIHAICDDASRYIIAIEAASREREVEMLALWVKAIRRHGVPQVLYLDNGSTYSGAALQTACVRLGVTLVHAQPYDPQARGKMERFWRTLRENVLDHLGHQASLHDVQVRLLAFLDTHYHQSPHASLVGKSPGQAFFNQAHATGSKRVTEKEIEAAMTVRERRRVKRDGTVQVGGRVWELDCGFLAGRNITIARTFIDTQRAPWAEHEGKVHPLTPLDAKKNARRVRVKKEKRTIDAIDFDPPSAMLNALVNPKGKRS